MNSVRVYERDTDALFMRLLRNRPDMRRSFVESITANRSPPVETFEVQGQVRHVAGTGSVDIVLRYRDGPLLLIENKIDAAYSITRAGHGQPMRYQISVAAFRELGIEAHSVLLAPASYLASSQLAKLFDTQISYESLRGFVKDDDDLKILDAAISQAQAPYEPLPNAGAGKFFAAIRQLISQRFPDLVMKHDPNEGGVRPDASRTVYFDVPQTLRRHDGVARPRMSLQCWDSAARSASVKIMLPDRARLANCVSVPQSLVDVGGYLRSAGRSLGITVDTPRLDTQMSFPDQVDDIVEALEAAVRLQGWWNENGELLRQWGCG